MALPNIKKANPDPAYVQKLLDDCRKRHGFTSYEQVAEAIGVTRSILKNWRNIGPYVPIPYVSQYTLEQLAYGKK